MKSVTLGLESGKTIDVPVQDGGYYVAVPASDPPRTIAYDGPNGAVSQQVPVAPPCRAADRKLRNGGGAHRAAAVLVPELLLLSVGD